ncbi:lysosomal acid glucosylceramidase-like [Pecten maximus]|uniref:lysosomal acid glucosylceramidase-like n=1 Tax=Pecten maximus TaxID=6579 RepID=UPI001458CCFD|nr:lysosomal acid glucosylceramidase-like [Pecten maximus]
MGRVILSVILLCFMYSDTVGTRCALKDFGGDNFVCVCNSTYCDKLDPVTPPPPGGYKLYTSSINGQRLDQTFGQLTPQPSSKVILKLNPNVTYQEILGFGGAFTDAAGINILNLTTPTQENLLKSYFSTQGIEYNLGRIPMASCDFSTRLYSYDDVPGDLNLTKFSLATEDLKFKIPIIQAAQNFSKRNITLFGSPWSAPAWMKTNDKMTGRGSLIGQPGGQYYKAWAMYFVKFLQEYKKHGVDIWGVTGQNEPSDGNIFDFKFQAMGWSPETQRDFIAMDLGPAMGNSGFSHVKIMIMDDTRLFLPLWAEEVFKNTEAAKFVSGIAVHWYQDFVVPANALASTHEKFPDKFILATEACLGSMPWDGRHVQLGSWYRGELYAHDIIEDLSNWVTGWTDWNIALNMEGGPNWVQNFVDSPIIVNAEKDEFYKQPMFYAMGHFSKFLVPGSQRIEIQNSVPDEEVFMVAFKRPDSLLVFIILNRSELSGSFSLTRTGQEFVNLYYAPHSLQTVLMRI